MKKLVYSLIVIMLLHTVSYAQIGGDPGFGTIAFEDTSIPVGATTVFTMELGNKSINGPIPANSFAVLIAFGRTSEGNSYQPDPLNISAIELVTNEPGYVTSEHFTWTYNVNDNTFVGILHTAMPVFTSYKIKIRIKGVKENSLGAQTNASIQIMDQTGLRDNLANNSLLLSLPVEGAQPVTLTHFTASKEHTSTALSWATADEVNSDRFEIQRSFDNKSWHQIGEVAAYGNSTTLKNYQFNDEYPANGDNYYRLKMIDKDGSFEMSKHQSVVFENLEHISVFPNPTADLVNLKISDAPSVEKIVLQSISGQTIYTATQNIQKPIDIKRYPAGTYLIQVHRNDGRTTTHKIVKQ